MNLLGSIGAWRQVAWATLLVLLVTSVATIMANPAEAKPKGPKEPKSDATFVVTFAVDVVGDTTITNRLNGNPTGVFSVEVGTLTADLAFFANELPGGATCFPLDPTGKFMPLIEQFSVFEDSDAPQVTSKIFFFAEGTEGSDIRYILEMVGTITHGPWLPDPPGPGADSLATVMLTGWEMRAPKGKTRKVACVGHGSFATILTVERTS